MAPYDDMMSTGSTYGQPYGSDPMYSDQSSSPVLFGQGGFYGQQFAPTYPMHYGYPTPYAGRYGYPSAVGYPSGYGGGGYRFPEEYDEDPYRSDERRACCFGRRPFGFGGSPFGFGLGFGAPFGLFPFFFI